MKSRTSLSSLSDTWPIQDEPLSSSSGPLMRATLLSKMGEGTWSKKPVSVFSDLNLEHLDTRVYDVLVYRVRRGNVAHVGARAIAKIIGVGKSTVERSIKNLERFGHIVRHNAKRGERAYFTITSAAFKQRQGISAKCEVLVAEVPKKETVKCPKCQKQCFQILKTGQCRSCNHKADLIRLIDTRIDKRIA